MCDVNFFQTLLTSMDIIVQGWEWDGFSAGTLLPARPILASDEIFHTRPPCRYPNYPWPGRYSWIP